MAIEAVINDLIAQLQEANRARMDLAFRLADAEANAARYIWLRDEADANQWERASHSLPASTDSIVDYMRSD